MKVTIAIGGVEVTTSGLELDYAQVRSLMRHAASIALALPRDDPETTVEPERHPLGFTAHTEIVPQEIEALPYWDDEE